MDTVRIWITAILALAGFCCLCGDSEETTAFLVSKLIGVVFIGLAVLTASRGKEVRK